MVLYAPGGYSEAVRIEPYLINGWYQSCGYSGCNCPQFQMTVPPGWHADPSWNECATKYCCGGHGGCSYCIMTQSQAIADYRTEVTFISDPIGARIFIDGIEWWSGAVTAADGATFRGIPPGSHRYELILAEHIGAKGTFELILDTPITVTGTLYPLSILGELSISSTPLGAEILLAPTGQTLVDQGVTTPHIISNLPEGWYDYKLTLSGYIDATGTFNIVAGETNILDVVLVPSTGSLSIISIPPGAQIYIDNVIQIGTTPATISGLSLGSHTYKLTLSGYIDATGTFDIVAGETTTKSVTMTLVIGTLSITSTPIGAKIYINDEEQIGVTTPATIQLVPEHYTYKLTLRGYTDKTGIFDIMADQTMIIEDTLSSTGMGIGIFALAGVVALGLMMRSKVSS